MTSNIARISNISIIGPWQSFFVLTTIAIPRDWLMLDVILEYCLWLLCLRFHLNAEIIRYKNTVWNRIVCTLWVLLLHCTYLAGLSWFS